jgi:hypothetical protein
MPRVRVIHWREAEAAAVIEACGRGGFEVDYTGGGAMAVCRAIRASIPDAVAIDLSRLPSHGREVAVWLRRTKATRHIPLVFVGGEPAKVASIRELLPDAGYCEIGKLAAALKASIRALRTAPVVPAGIMDRFHERTAAQKLGIVPGASVAVIDPPRNFPELLGGLPDAVDFCEDEAPLTLWFLYDRDGLLGSLRQIRVVAGRTKLWLLWRKKNPASDLTQGFVRESAREVGLVDYKICSVDAVWSAMLFARKKA